MKPPAEPRVTDETPVVRRVVQASIEHAKHGAFVLRAGVVEPPHDSVGARVGWGAGLPFAILRRVLADPEQRRVYLRTKLPQLAIVVGLTLLATWVSPPGRDAEIVSSGLKLQVHSAAGRLVEVISYVYGLMVAFEWIVIALSRQFDDQIGGAASDLVGVPRDDAPAPPRVRLDFGWLWRKGKRRLRGLRMILSGVPALMWLGVVPVVGSSLWGASITAWSFFWLTAFLAATTSSGWLEETTAGDPFFVRLADRIAARLPRALAWPFSIFARFSRWMSRSMRSPVAAVERAPASYLGLAACRTVIGLPGVYLFLRPFFPVAAARINVEHPPPLPVVTSSADEHLEQAVDGLPVGGP